jgi:CheY-like chemotaxis protein
MGTLSNILIVEDEATTALYLKLAFQKIGYQAETVPSGPKAIEYVNKGSVDVVIMDIQLADEMDGIEAASILREKCDCKIIFMTGYQDREYREKAMKLEPLAYLVKPVKASDIDSILQGKQAQ